jgi:thioredoxin reductase (NADPH)
MFDLAIVGAGPIGLETAILAKRAGLSYVVLEKGTVVNAIYNYPTYMTFFTTSERLEIGNHPLITATDKPTRKEALDYYRKVCHNESLEIRQFTTVTGLHQNPRGFVLSCQTAGQETQLEARKVAIATGYFDHPKPLGIPGEELPHVSHYYSENHSFFGREVTIIGAGSSAADAALDLYRGGARVTMIHRGEDFRHSLKYWIRPNLENRVKEGSITAHFNTVVERITSDTVYADKLGEKLVIPSVQTFALTGYFAAPELLEQAGVEVRPEDYSVILNEETYETNVPGLYALGSAGYGTRTSDVFIENGLVHVHKAMADIRKKLTPELA